MAADEERVFEALGDVRAQVVSLSDQLAALAQRSQQEHREVHNIVVSMSEAVRNLTRSVDEMRPYVEVFKMKAEKLDDAILAAKEYRTEKAEERGAERFKKWIYGLVASVSALATVGLGKVIDRIWPAVHLPPGPHQ